MRDTLLEDITTAIGAAYRWLGDCIRKIITSQHNAFIQDVSAIIRRECVAESRPDLTARFWVVLTDDRQVTYAFDGAGVDALMQVARNAHPKTAMSIAETVSGLFAGEIPYAKSFSKTTEQTGKPIVFSVSSARYRGDSPTVLASQDALYDDQMVLYPISRVGKMRMLVIYPAAYMDDGTRILDACSEALKQRFAANSKAVATVLQRLKTKGSSFIDWSQIGSFLGAFTKELITP